MRRVFVLLAGTVLSIAALLFAASRWAGSEKQHAPAEMYASLAEHGKALPRLWQAPAFSYLDQAGQPATRESFRGRPWIVDFIFTQCASACPMITSHMVLLQRALGGAGIAFVSISVDPEHDTPAALADYAHHWNPQETRWKLLSTKPEELKKTVEGFAVTAEASNDPANPIVHSSVFLLVDGEGWIRGVYDSNDSEARVRLVTDARGLTGVDSQVAQGQPVSLNGSLGCAGCHAHANLAPPLEGLFGRPVTIEGGTTVTADDTYLRRSILEPGAQIVAGYLPLMPSYAGELSDGQVTMLVDEIKRTVAPPGQAVQDASVSLVADPVCQMKVRASPDAPHTTYEGHDYFFCSNECRKEFLANPRAFTTDKAGHGAR